MKKFKRLFTFLVLVILLLTIASCGGKKSTRNTTVPYGEMDLSTIVAKSNDKNIELTQGTFYSRLRAKGYDIFFEELKKVVYSKELNALKELIKSSSFSDLSETTLKNLSFKETPITARDYDDLKKINLEYLSNSILSSIFSSSNIYTINGKTDKEIQKNIDQYVDSMLRKGYTINKNNISYTDSDGDGTAEIDLIKIPQNIIDNLLIARAENLYAQKELYKIADLEYIKNDDDKDERNSNYLFNEENSIIPTYNNSYKTFGDFKAIIITYNSRRDAMESMKHLSGKITAANVEESYLTLYNDYYSGLGTKDINSDEFVYTVSEDKNELSEISSSISTLITDTLEDGEFLTEPRNINGKYVLAYRISSTYDYEEKEYADLSETQKTEVTEKIKTNLIRANASSYTSTAFNQFIKNNSLEIYDPLFEYRFRNSYTNYYDLINKNNENVGKDLIFKLNDVEYSVYDFYAIASSRLASTVITEYFQQEYVLNYKDEFIKEETLKNNKNEIDTAVSNFEKNKNTTYPKEIGLETYLLNAYGYPTKDDVLKYYYNAASCLSSYKAKVLFNEWTTEDHQISDDAKKVLNRILSIGNNAYSTLFEMNVDHILINIDYNADGTPDDPNRFVAEHPEIKDRFEQAVTNLAQAIYKEATYISYKENKLYDTLAYIVNQYNKGADLLSSTSTPKDNWDNYKKDFNFILRAEQLASSSDITQDSVSNFVVPFADYIKDMYQKASKDEVKLDDNGNFFTVADGKLENENDYSKITYETLCKTVYGYHLIVLNSFDGPDSLKFTKDNDSNGYQEKIQVLLYEDPDDEDKNVYAELSSYNNDAEGDEANINQLYIYYVQSRNGSSSSLDSNIVSLLSSLFSTPIEKYTSSNFQTMVLLDEINITSTDEKLSKLIGVERDYYANLVIDYDSTSDYIDWIAKDMDWKRPNQK